MFLIVATLLGGCAGIGDESVQSTDNKSVGNVKDSFGYSMSAVNKTKIEVYKWENGASKAMIGYSGAVQKGHLSLTIKDAAGLTVYSGEYSGNDSQGLSTQRGLAGTWTIEMEFDAYYGALSLGVTAHYGATL